MPALVDEGVFEATWAVVESQVTVAAAALLMHGMFLLTFVLALFLLLRNHTPAQRVLLFTAIILAMFAIVQVSLDAALVSVISSVLQIQMKEGMTERVVGLLDAFSTIYDVRLGAFAINNVIADGLFLYRCSMIWSSSRYAPVIVAIPLLLILTNTAIGFAAIYLVLDIRIPFAFALLTNLVLFGLTAGRIWNKRRAAAALLGITAHRRYTTTLEVVLESSLLYAICDILYISSITKSVPPFGAFQNICWGSLAQLVNILPMMIVVRVALARTPPPASTVSTSYKEVV
ncbi:hypothetical protein MVEN_00461500 [Mycena venus]|uniref:Uncharacterized protein n=1 Tax=Mycena venus TaxID=2733690 RepID=A0A8H6YWA1_9AGAR|nr:hypothetical protein MVEN_00461500 [Mycena venus]